MWLGWLRDSLRTVWQGWQLAGLSGLSGRTPRVLASLYNSTTCGDSEVYLSQHHNVRALGQRRLAVPACVAKLGVCRTPVSRLVRAIAIFMGPPVPVFDLWLFKLKT